MRWIKGLLAYCVASVFVAAGSATAAEFFGIGDLPGGTFNSGAHGVGDDGRYVVGTGRSAAGVEAFLWSRDGGMIGLGDLLGGFYSSGATAVSRDGSVVVGIAHSSTGPEAFRWSATMGMVGLGDLAGGLANSEAADVSSDGTIVVGNANSAAGQEAYRWTESTGIVGLGAVSSATAISQDGRTITGGTQNAFTPGFVQEAFRWTEMEGMTGISIPGASLHAASDISNNGVIVGQGVINGSLEAVRWTAATGVVALGETFGGGATAVSADGRVIVGFTHGGSQAFVWRQPVGLMPLTDVLKSFGLSTQGWSDLSVADVSADGTTLVGGGRHADGTFEAWVAVLPIPEPSASILAGSAMAACLARLRRRSRQL